jgi:hypothetical protein
MTVGLTQEAQHPTPQHAPTRMFNSIKFRPVVDALGFLRQPSLHANVAPSRLQALFRRHLSPRRRGDY